MDALNRAFVVNAGRSLIRKLKRLPAHLRYESPGALERILADQGFRDVTVFWMPIAPPRLPALQRFVETGFIRWMLRVVPLFGVLISHSFIIRGTKPFRPSAAPSTPQ